MLGKAGTNQKDRILVGNPLLRAPDINIRDQFHNITGEKTSLDKSAAFCNAVL
jgi:hypothetical protein